MLTRPESCAAGTDGRAALCFWSCCSCITGLHSAIRCTTGASAAGGWRATQTTRSSRRTLDHVWRCLDASPDEIDEALAEAKLFGRGVTEVAREKMIGVHATTRCQVLGKQYNFVWLGAATAQWGVAQQLEGGVGQMPGRVRGRPTLSPLELMARVERASGSEVRYQRYSGPLRHYDENLAHTG